MVDLSEKWILNELEKAPEIAYLDVLKEFDLVWCGKGLIVTRSDLVVTWTVGH